MKWGVLLLGLMLSGCQTYKYAANVKLISFTDDIEKGKSTGPIRGQDCVWKVFGRWVGVEPTLDKAARNAATQGDTGFVSDTFGGADYKGLAVRYLNDVRTDWEGFDVWFVGKKCLIVQGKGYK